MRNHFRSTRTALTLTLILAAIGTIAQASSYRVEFLPGRSDDDGALRRARVEAHLLPRDGRIGFLRSGADTGLYHQWATFLLDIAAVDAAGEPLDLVYEPPGAWQVEGWPGGEVTVRYTMLLQHDRFPNEPGDDELAAARPYGVMWTTRALLVEGAPAADIGVVFDLPEGWIVTTPWKHTAGSANRFTAHDNDDLLDSAFLAGRHREVSVPVGEGEARLALGPPVAATEALFSPLLESYLGYYTTLFGESPKDAILLIALDASFLGGGVMGRTISLSLDREMDPAAAAPLVAYVIAHEGFHLWGTQWKAAPGHEGELEWLNEGAADYYALLAARRLGQIDDAAFLARLAEHYAKYLGARSAGESLVSAAATKLQAQTSYDLIYSGGASALATIDLTLRQLSGGARSVDDLLRALYLEYRAPGGRGLSLAELADAAERVAAGSPTGDAVREILRNQVSGTQSIALGEALAGVGLVLEVSRDEGEPAVEIHHLSEPTAPQEAAYAAWIRGARGVGEVGGPS
jgi:predicted metalloprotease with PDZ domain